MIQKRILSNFISKYHLNGLIEKVQWNSDDNVKTGFINDSQTLLGYVTLKDVDFPKGKLGIFNTGTLTKMLNILDGELLIDITKTNGIPAKLNLEDTNYSISCNLADPSIIKSLPLQSTPPTPASKFDITQEFINRFIKSKDALSDLEAFTVKTDEGFNGNELVFTLGTETESNRIKFSVGVDKDDFLPKSPYNADLLREILKCNRTCLSGEFFVYSEGLIMMKFVEEQIESKYYLIRNQN
jgi:hypothetical protein